MPEGDSLRRVARALAPLLEGEVLTKAWFRSLRGHRPRVGHRIRAVRAVGKYLLIEFERPLDLYTHLGMSGSWRVGRCDDALPEDPRLRIALETQKGRALCFAAPRIFTHVRGSGPSPIGHLGPDLSDDGVDISAVVARARDYSGDKTVAEMLLDQRVAAGVGNVFKSEALFVAGVFPFAKVAAQSDDELAALWLVAHRQLVANRDRSTRSTTRRRRENTFVYGRGRRGCRRCHDAIEFSSSGARTARSTYWCPTCQPAPGEPQ